MKLLNTVADRNRLGVLTKLLLRKELVTVKGFYGRGGAGWSQIFVVKTLDLIHSFMIPTVSSVLVNEP